MRKEIELGEIQQIIRETIKDILEQQIRPASEIVLDDVDLRNLLKISRRTALEYRKMKIFNFYRLNNKIYYILSEVIEGLKAKGGNNEHN